jgi:LysM repeat protein
MEESKVTKPKTEEQFVHVTVKKGDFLEKIAKTNNTTIAAIVKANNLSSTQLKIGQVLKVPLSEREKPHQKPFPSPSTSREGEYYTVKEGDNPWLIASRNKIQLEELLRLNGLDEQKAKRLRPGDKLKIR